jgi:putative oxidoreductase
MKILHNNFLLRLPMAIILITHGVGGMFNNGVNDFGNLFLNQIGFAPFGIYIAWILKISHLVCAVCLLLNRYIKWPAIVTIFILLMGIVLVHFKEGWFVVGGGRNGWEYNFLLIFVLLSIVLRDGLNNRGSHSKKTTGAEM